ncbi:cation:proton antiporter [Kitasatospora sp. MAP5-34]|uniref:cation:proton antiporter n=1 Tax=Kitasatospora sp. MAP5-34 TaxID=3035102 RepID=UPI00247409A7|nr:cation:proton antiporter [Kitasatospora sp. MAP5-34]MDH6579829.1 Kef-type K+ transport system membrane component KefB [Kitasatospora sp. MAP5-34]
MSSGQAEALFLALAVVLALARLLGAAARLAGQPAVLGEILGGILIGPTFFHGAVARQLLPAAVQPYLGALAGLGLALFMFLVGFEMEHALLRAQLRTAAGVALCSVAVPFVLGVLLATQLVQHHQVRSRAGFVVFLGAAMAVTAFPVLARMLADRQMLRTQVGGIALASAAASDLLAWLLLAVVVVVAGGPAQWRLVLVPVYLAVLVGVVRPVLRRVLAAREPGQDRDGGEGGGVVLASGAVAAVLGGLMLSCWATEWLGLHYIFGAFVFGAVMPRGGGRRVHEGITESLRSLGVVFLLPVFFVTAGLKVDLSHLGSRQLGELALILVTAVTGKALGAFAGARAQRIPARQAGVLAALMNARGLTELVILSVGLQLGVLDQDLYSLMVVMAMVTTFMTGPALRLLYPKTQAEQDRRAAEGGPAAGLERTGPAQAGRAPVA